MTNIVNSTLPTPNNHSEKNKPDGVFVIKQGKTNYKVKVFFDHSSGLTAEDRLKRIIQAEAERESAFLYAATSLLLTKSYLYIPSGLATTLHFLYPVLVTLLMVTFFKDKVSVSIIIATIMAIGGVYLLSGSEGGTLNSTGLALALTTVLTYASYIVGINKSSVSDMDGLKLTFYVLLSGAFIFLLNLIVNREMLTPIPSWEIGVDLILLALVPTLISDLTLILAVQHVGSTTTAVLGCMEPLTAVIMGVLFLGESCNFIQSIGICIILIAVTTVIIARNPHEIKKGLQLIPKLLHKSRVK